MKEKFDEPLNQSERYLYGMLIRLDALCNMLSSLVEHIAERDGVATASNETVTVKEESPETAITATEEVVEKPKKTRKK